MMKKKWKQIECLKKKKMFEILKSKNSFMLQCFFLVYCCNLSLPTTPPPLHSECFQGFLHFILCLDWVPQGLIFPLPSVNLGQIPTTPITPLLTHTAHSSCVCMESPLCRVLWKWAVKLSSTNSALTQIFQPHSEAPVLFWFVFSSKWWTRS